MFILQALADERESILNTLKRQESVTEQLSQEKQNLSLTKLELKAKLDNIEEKTQTLLQEKSEAEVRCVQNHQIRPNKNYNFMCVSGNGSEHFR